MSLVFTPQLFTLLFTSNHLERILHQLSEAIVAVINATDRRRQFIPHVLHDLVKLKNRPKSLTGMAYEWCSVICESQNSKDRERLLLDSLEIGFRHLDPQNVEVQDLYFTHTDHHRGLVDVVFRSQNSEAIADLLCAWVMENRRLEPPHTLLGLCAEHLVDLHNVVPFSSKLRQLIIRSVGIIGYKGFEGVGVERFVEWLNYLYVDDMVYKDKWRSLLLGTIQSLGGARYLSYQFWELLAELMIWLPPSSSSSFLEAEGYTTYSPQVTVSLLEAEEWDKLECWIGIVWITWPPETEETTENLKCTMVSLFRHRPGAAEILTQWMEERGKEGGVVSEYFERICEQAHGVAQQDLP